MTTNRFTPPEDEFETVKQLLASAASYAESANRRLDRVSAQQETNTLAIAQQGANIALLVDRQRQTDSRIERLSDRVDAFVFEAQRLLSNQGDRLARVEASIETLAASVTHLAQIAEADRAVMQQMQSEIRGLQTENHRILEYLQEQRRGDTGNDN